MHENNVAHRDYCRANIMMDGTPLYPDGFHPGVQDLIPSAMDNAKHLRRCEVDGVKYYVTDFGLSTHFTKADQSRLVTGATIQDHDVPELSHFIPYDPFLVDVFTLGNIFKKEFMQNYRNLSFIEPLVSSMTRKIPKERPTVFEAISMFNALIEQRPPYLLRWRLQSVSNGIVGRFLVNLHSITPSSSYRLRNRNTKQAVISGLSTNTTVLDN